MTTRSSPRRVEEPEDVTGVVLHRVSRRRLVALTAAAQVEREHAGGVPSPACTSPSKEWAFAVRPGASTSVGPSPP